LALGDTITDIINATGNYQPSAGVSVCLTQSGDTGAGDQYAVYDGADVAGYQGQSVIGQVRRIYIDNTNYFRYTNASGVDGLLTGVIVG
jgi:hypothetical protein